MGHACQHGATRLRAHRRLGACSLHLLFGKALEGAAPLIEAGLVTCVQGAASKRRIFQVTGSKGDSKYHVLPFGFCSCPAFHNLVTRDTGKGLYVRYFFYQTKGWSELQG